MAQQPPPQSDVSSYKNSASPQSLKLGPMLCLLEGKTLTMRPLPTFFYFYFELYLANYDLKETFIDFYRWVPLPSLASASLENTRLS